MNQRQLEVFVELAFYRSFSQTAHQLNISQSTVTKQLKNLEKELGCSLIDRQTGTLTEEGELVYEKAIGWLNEWKQVRNICQKRSRTYTKTLRIGASTTPGTYFLPSICKKCHEYYPSWRLNLYIDDSTTIWTLLMENKIDIALIGASITTSPFFSYPIWEDKLAIIAPPGVSKQPITRFEELKEYAFVKRKEGSGTYKAVQTALYKWGGSLPQLETAAVVPNTESLLSLVEAGIGYGFLSEYALSAALKRGCVLKGYLPTKRQFYIAYPQEKQGNETIAAFERAAKEWREEQ